jgi:hypothetical protein
MLDTILTDSTHKSYLNDNINLMKWCEENEPDWVTEFGTVQIARLHEGDEKGRSFKEGKDPMSIAPPFPRIDRKIGRSSTAS